MPEQTHEELASGVLEEMSHAMDSMSSYMDMVVSQPGLAMANLTHFGLKLSQRCQELADGIVSVSPEADRTFLFLDNAMYNDRGQLLTVEREYFDKVLYGGRNDDWGPA